MILLLYSIPLPASDRGVVISGYRDSGPSAVDIISVSDSDRQVKTVSEVLEARAGVQVTRYGTAGSYSSIYVRGTNANQIVVYIDGIPLSDSVSGEVNFENIPLDSIDRIEIYKSFAPLYFGTPGIGGVINIVTKKRMNFPETGITVSAGSFGTYRLSAFSSQSGERSSFLVTASGSSGKGNFPFKNGNGTEFNAGDDFNDRRKNNGFKTGSVTARCTSGTENSSFDALCDLFVKKQGVASYNNTASDASFETVRSLNNLRASFNKIGGIDLTEHLSVFANVKRDTYDDLDSEIGFLGEKNTGTYVSYGAGSYTSFESGNIFRELSLSLQCQNELYYLKNETASDSTSYPLQKRRSLKGGVQDTISFAGQRILVIPQIRYAVRNDSFTGDTGSSRSVYSFDPQAGAVFNIIRDLLYLKGSYGTNHRAPGFSEMFGNTGSVAGNRNLKDESSCGYDATIGLSAAGFVSDAVQSFTLEYSYFSSRIRNIIIYMQNSQNTMKAENISEASIEGHELAAAVAILEHLDLSCNATIQYARDQSDIAYYKGNYLPHRPIFEGGAAVKFFNRYGSLTYQYNYSGGNYRDRANSPSLYIKRRVYHTLTAVYTPRFDLTVTFESKNIANDRTQDVAGYPLPGRSFTGSVQYIF